MSKKRGELKLGKFTFIQTQTKNDKNSFFFAHFFAIFHIEKGFFSSRHAQKAGKEVTKQKKRIRRRRDLDGRFFLNFEPEMIPLFLVAFLSLNMTL